MGSNVTLPAVFRAPIRPDIVNFVHFEMKKNGRQPYAVSKAAGHQTSAESWGTGVLLHVSPVSVVVVPTAPAREPSATCAVADACLLPQSPGAAGTARSM